MRRLPKHVTFALLTFDVQSRKFSISLRVTHRMFPFFILDRFVSEFIALTSFASPFWCCIFIFLTFVIVYFVARHVYLGYFVARHVSLLYFVVRHGMPSTLFLYVTVLS
jgi:hypothetical protein